MSKKVLVVDDNRPTLKVIKAILTQEKYTVITTPSPAEALEIISETGADVCLVDLKMPDMDGLVTITKLKEIHPDIRTVLLTGFGDEKVQEAAEALNASYFEKDAMGGFWNFMKRLQKNLEDSMVDATMAGYSDSSAKDKTGKK